MTARNAPSAVEPAGQGGPSRGAYRARVLTGAAAIEGLRQSAEFIDELSEEFCTTSTWLLAAAELLPGNAAIMVLDRDGGVVGLAPLSVVSRGPVRDISFLGGEHVDYCRLFARDRHAALVLGDALADWLGSLPAWSLELVQLHPGDPVLARLAQRLPNVSVAAGPPMPRIEHLERGFEIGRTWRKHVKSAENRLRTDQRDVEHLVVTSPAELARWLPAVIEVRRGRDHALGRRSQLDAPRVQAFYTRVVQEAVAAGRCRIYLQVVDGQVGGFSTIMLDGDTHRIFDGRVAEDFQRYKGGLTTAVHAVEDAIGTPGVVTYDWLRGSSPTKFGNAEIRRAGLSAVSHRAIRVAAQSRVRTKALIKRAVPDDVVRRLARR